MGKLHTEMIFQSGKLLTDAVRLKAPDKRTKALVGGLLGLVGLAVMQETILNQLGYERDTFGYRYTKKVIDENGNEKEYNLKIQSRYTKKDGTVHYKCTPTRQNYN